MGSAQVPILLQLGGFPLPRHGFDEIGRPAAGLFERPPHIFPDNPERQQLQPGQADEDRQQEQDSGPERRKE